MSFVESFGKKLSEYIQHGFKEFTNSGFKENTKESIEFILISKPVLKLMADFEPEEKEKEVLEHNLTYKQLGSLEKVLKKELTPLRDIIKRGYEKISEERMLELIYYSKDFNKLISKVYDALRYKNQKEEFIPENHQWIQKP